MAGQVEDFNGEAWAADGIKVGYLPQEPELDESKDVIGNAMEGVAEKKAMVDRFNELATNYSEETADEMAELQDKIDALDLWDLDSQVEQALDALRCPPAIRTSPSCQAVRSAASRLRNCLLSKPDILLLDEPTNHLDAESVAWLERFLIEYAGCVILVTHDRYFLDNITEWTLELDRGQGVPYKGNYSDWLEQKAKRLEAEEGQEESREQRPQARTRMDPLDAARAQAKSKARIQAYEKMAEDAGKRAGQPRPDPDRPGRSSATSSSRRRPQQGLRRPPADRRSDVQAATGRHRRRDRPERCR
jgi:ATPase subunit of ABC transporter with duplicated ATPase domains